MEFLKDFTTSFAGGLSGLAYINASIVQGSDIELIRRVTSAPHTSTSRNYLFKFADDPYLMVWYLTRSTIRGVNLILHLGIVDPGLKSGRSCVLKVQQLEACNT